MMEYHQISSEVKICLDFMKLRSVVIKGLGVLATEEGGGHFTLSSSDYSASQMNPLNDF